MKLRLDKDGNLWIDRGHGERRAFCPSVSADGDFAGYCGEHCALFGEYDPKEKRLDLCNEQYAEGELTDDRDQEPDTGTAAEHGPDPRE